jgi:two-component system nitrate/nitrite response regulator NarL
MGSLSRVRVYIADDHPVYREGLARAIKQRPDLELVGDSGEGQKALAEINELAPDVAVLDVRMPGLDGLRVLNAIKRDSLPTRVVFVTGFLEAKPVFEALAAGAGGFVSKASDHVTICDTVVAVSRGETVVAPEFQAGLADQIRLNQQDDRPALSDREREVLGLAAEGLSVAEIGKHLHLSPATVKTHLQRLYEKLGVSDRAAAVATAMRQGLIE